MPSERPHSEHNHVTVSEYGDNASYDFCFYELNNRILAESAEKHAAYNIWHGIDDVFFYARPKTPLSLYSHIYIQHNLHPIFSATSNKEIVDPYVSPIIRYCSRRRWPSFHKANRIPALPTEWLPGQYIVAGWVDDIHNYYHLLFDLCPRILLILSNPAISHNLPIVIIGSYNKLIQAVINALFPGISDRLKFIDAPSVVIENAILPLTPQPSYMDIASIRELSLIVKNRIRSTRQTSLLSPSSDESIIYVFRGQGKNGRQISNESSFSQALSQELNARVIRPFAIDPLDQWIEFSKARIIIAPHGAALSNLLAARENAIVIELIPHSYQASTFNFISAALGLRYQRICYDDSNPNIPIGPVLDRLKCLLAA